MSSDYDLERAFWTPIIVASLTEAERINHMLEPPILLRYGERAEPGCRGGGWQSDKKLLDWGGEAASAIRDEAIRIAEAHTVDLDADRPGRARGWACEGWANIVGHGSYNKPHIHADTYWTVVYYVRVDAGKGGELALYDPRLPGIEMHAPQLRFRPSGGEGAINMSPEAGLLILFPGWVQHSIQPYFGDGHRISIAMNLSARFGPAVEHDPTVIRIA